MQELMPPIDTPDKIFHDGNMITGTPGTIVTAQHLNNVQSTIRATQEEVINVLTAAGININHEEKNQLLLAILSLIERDMQDASTTIRGMVQLNDSIDSVSQTEAATPNAVKKAYDLAASKLSSVPVISVQGKTGSINLTAEDIGFSGAINYNGWQQLPSGLIMQWGVANVGLKYGHGGFGDVNLPIAFPNGIFIVSANLVRSG